MNQNLAMDDKEAPEGTILFSSSSLLSDTKGGGEISGHPVFMPHLMKNEPKVLRKCLLIFERFLMVRAESDQGILTFCKAIA
jgi:hypothetical protein